MSTLSDLGRKAPFTCLLSKNSKKISHVLCRPCSLFPNVARFVRCLKFIHEPLMAVVLFFCKIYIFLGVPMQDIVIPIM